MNRRKPKTTYMSDETFAELMKSLEQALDYERGGREGYRVTRVEIPQLPQSEEGKGTRQKRSARRQRQLF